MAVVISISCYTRYTHDTEIWAHGVTRYVYTYIWLAIKVYILKGMYAHLQAYVLGAIQRSYYDGNGVADNSVNIHT